MSASASSFGYPDPRGLLGLREALVDYLARVRGVRTSADQVVICSGFTQALALIASVLSDGGGREIAVESYGLEEHRRIITAADIRTVAVPLDEFGARTDLLSTESAVLLTPSHQFPTGVPLNSGRRSDVIAWAARTGGLIIEDDYDGEFRFDRDPVKALQSDAPDHVAYVGTASKSLAPGVSLAWLVLPRRLVRSVMAAKTVSDGFTGVLEQMALEEFIRSGAYDRHVRESRLRYRKRRDELISTVTTACPHVAVSGISAGLHAVLKLSGVPASEEPRLRLAAARAGLTVRTLDSFRFQADSTTDASLVIGYGSLPGHAFSEAVSILCRLLKSPDV